MPLYEYKCESCAHRFERIQKFSDPPLDTCPQCGGAVRKLLSSPAIQFKGSGFYITDYAKKSGTDAGKGEGKGEGKAEAKAEGKGEGKADGKSETKTESKPDSSPKSE